MKDEMVVTNLRLPKSDLIQIRVRAAELGISQNEYIKRLIKVAPYKKKSSIWNLPKIAARHKNRKGLELSEEDEIIYGV